MGTQQPIRKELTPDIPDKLYFRIGDVAALCGVQSYVLRFWESEFASLKPHKGGNGQRLYRKRDVEMALRIKALLYDQGYTIPGARGVFKAEAKAKELPITEVAPGVQTMPHPADIRVDTQLQALRSEMRSLLNLLSKPVSADHAPVRGKVKTMSPRLVLEPRPTPVAVEPSRLKLEQRDLFGGDPDIPA